MKIAVGLSGGVDSAAAALLLKERGHDLLGVTMTLGRSCDFKTVVEAADVARQLEIPLVTVDLAEAFSAQVLGYIKSEYLDGRTPNPCVRCNEFVKFSLLPRHAFEKLGCDHFATGHYARLENGMLLRGVDRTKDQSYFLYRVEPEILARTIFPLGDLTKAEARELVKSRGITLAEKAESQDFCGGDVREFLPREPREGEVVTTEGKVIGRHPGFWNFTVGMRKGLGTGGGGVPYYVIGIVAEHNRVIVGTRDQAAVSEFRIKDVVYCTPGRGRPGNEFSPGRGCPGNEFSPGRERPGEQELSVKVRSAGEPRGSARLSPDGLVTLATPIHGVAPGQSAVFYDGDRVVAGGVIFCAKTLVFNTTRQQ